VISMMVLMLLCLVLAAMSGVILAHGQAVAAVLGFTFATLFTLAAVAKLEKEKAHR